MAFVLSINLFQNKQFHLVHIHTFHFSFCSHSGKPLYAERGIAHFTLSSGTDQSYKKLYILFDIAENMSKINLNEFVWLIGFAVKYMPKYSQ